MDVSKSFLESAQPDLAGPYSEICGDIESYKYIDQDRFREHVLKNERLDIYSSHVQYGPQFKEVAIQWLTNYLDDGRNCPKQSKFWQEQRSEDGRTTLEMAISDMERRQDSSKVSKIPEKPLKRLHYPPPPSRRLPATPHPAPPPLPPAAHLASPSAKSPLPLPKAAPSAPPPTPHPAPSPLQPAAHLASPSAKSPLPLPKAAPSAPPPTSHPAINIADLFDVPEIPPLPSKDQILEIFKVSNDEAPLYTAWGDFRIQYLKAMSAIVQRLFFTDPEFGDQHNLDNVFSTDKEIWNKTRSEIEVISEETEKFAGEVFTKAMFTFADKLSVPKRALFMAEFSMIQNLRQKALELGRSLDPRDNISDKDLREHIKGFQSAWATMSNPAAWTESVLSGMRAYISNRHGFWNRLAKSKRLWRLKKIKVAQSGNLVSIPFHKKMLFLGLIDRLLIEASGRNLSGLNVEIDFDGKNRYVTIHSEDDSFDDLKNDKSFKEIKEQLGGVWERPASWLARLFVVWRRLRIPLSSQKSTTPPLPDSLFRNGPSQGGAESASAGRAESASAGGVETGKPDMDAQNSQIVATDYNVMDETVNGISQFLGIGVCKTPGFSPAFSALALIR